MCTLSNFALITTTLLAASVSATFNALSKNNVVTYWGQGPSQQRLIETCKNPSIDIISIGFVNVFPDQGPGGWPGTNFGNACWGDVYNNTAGVPTALLKTCPYIGQDVIDCQQIYGKKIFLSIGGGYPTNYYIKSNASGQKFAQFLWSAFGPVSATTSTVPRPWGNATVDGFDFDTENIMSPAPTKNYMTSGYVAMINYFKNTLYPQDTSKSYYISGAPQCVIPDQHFTTVIQNAWFDFLFIQFYNTPSCSARAAINKTQGLGTNDISYSSWVASKSLNKNVRMSIGLPAAPAAAIDPSYYLNTTEAQTLITSFYNQNLFGGIVLWEATYNQNNVICGSNYSTWMKNILLARSSGKTLSTTCTVTSTTATSKSTTSKATTSTSTTLKTSTITSKTTSSTVSKRDVTVVPEYASSSSLQAYDSSSPAKTSDPSVTYNIVNYPESPETSTTTTSIGSSKTPYAGNSTSPVEPSCAATTTITTTTTSFIIVASAPTDSSPSVYSDPTSSGYGDNPSSSLPAVGSYDCATCFESAYASPTTSTSVEAVTVVPTPATSLAYPVAASVGYADASGLPPVVGGRNSSSMYPVPATGSAGVLQCSVLSTFFACMLAIFLL